MAYHHGARARVCVCLRIIIILPPLSWKGSRGIKRSRGSKEDDGFEVVPIEDPGKMYTVEKPKQVSAMRIRL